MDLLNFAIGVAVGLLTCAAALATFGKFMVRAIVKEVLEETSKNWVSVYQLSALEHRVDVLERKGD